MIEFTLNDSAARTTSDPTTPLIAVLRDELRFTGTKLGCDDGGCGSCTVLVNGRLARACQTPVGKVRGASVLTIEGWARRSARIPSSGPSSRRAPCSAASAFRA